MLNRMNYVWRVFATGFCFVSFGIGGLFLSVVVFPAVRLTCFDETKLQSRIRTTIQYSFILFVATLRFCCLFTFLFKNLDQMKSDRGVIIVANHPSLIDVAVLMSVIPNVNCIVKQSLFRNPLLRGVVSGAGYISNIESDNVLPLCKEALDKGENIIIFPEGTRSVVGEPLQLRRGAAQVAFRLQAPVRVIKITVKPSALTKGQPWYKIPKERAVFTVQVKKIISTISFLNSGLKPSIAARRITEEIRLTIDT